MSDPQTLNRYSYTRNNPVNLTDQGGLCSSGMSGGVDYVCATVVDDLTFTTLYGTTGEVGVVGTWKLPSCLYTPPYRGACYDRYSEDGKYGHYRSLLPLPSPKPPAPLPPAQAQSFFKRIVGDLCSAIPNAISVGAGIDAGLGVTQGYQVNLTANGSSGELTISMSGGFSIGLTSFDAYLSGGITPGPTDNSFLDSHGQPSASIALGVERVGADIPIGSGTYQATYGPSLLPVTAALQIQESKSLVTIPDAGYFLNAPAALCNTVGGW